MWLFPELFSFTPPPASGPKVVEGEAEKLSDSSVKEETPSCWKELSLVLKNETSDANVAISLWYILKK